MPSFKSRNFRLNVVFGLLVFVALSFLLQVFFVACGRFGPIESTLALKKSDNNGGGYTGLTSQFEGYYSSFSQAEQKGVDRYILWLSQGTNCSPVSSSEYDNVKSQVGGRLELSGDSVQYSSSACESLSEGSSAELAIFAFDSSVVIYQDKVFVLQPSGASLAVSDIERPVALCHDASDIKHVMSGLTVFIYEFQGQILGRVREGLETSSSSYQKRVVPSFVVRQEASHVYTGLSFTLSMQDPKVGLLSMTLDEQEIRKTLSCVTQF